jgi:hypothetical protein
MTEFRSPDYFMNVGNSMLASLVAALQCHGIDVPDRTFVGFNRPPQDCCPELVGWFGNIRTWDGDFPDSRLSGDLKCVWGYAFDFTVRIGRCYVDIDQEGNPIDAETLASWNAHLYADISALYTGWLAQWKAGAVTELSNYELVTIGTAQPYNDGGCAGWEFTITVGTF